MITNGEETHVLTDNVTLNETIGSLGASMAALRYERAPMCTIINKSGKGMISYQGDGYSVSRVTPRSMLPERQDRIKNWNNTNPGSNYLSTLLVSARTSDTPPSSPSVSIKRNPNWGIIATLIKRQEQSCNNDTLDEDGVNNVRHDTFAPWIKISDNSNEDILDQITVEGDEDLRVNIRKLLEKYRAIFNKNLSKEPALIPPFDLNVNLDKWNRPTNRGPPRVQTPAKQAEIFKQVDELLKKGIIVESSATYYSQVILASKPDNQWRFCIDYRSLADTKH